MKSRKELLTYCLELIAVCEKYLGSYDCRGCPLKVKGDCVMEASQSLTHKKFRQKLKNAIAQEDAKENE